jgi:hypothetical protein
MLVALAVGHPTDARTVSEQVDPDEFYRPALAAAIEAASQLGAVKNQATRVHIVAEATGIREMELEVWVANRIGPAARWARKIRASARRRRVMALAARIYNEAPDCAARELAAVGHDLLAELELLAAERDEYEAYLCQRAQKSS